MGIFGLGHKHLSAGTLNEYLDDRLSAGARDRVQQVIAGCPHCGLELEALRQTRLLLRQLPEVTPRRSFLISPSNEPVTAPPAPRRVRVPQWAYAGTASLAALVLTLMVVVDATGLVAPGRTTEQASDESPASSRLQQESSPVLMDSPAIESAALTESVEPASTVSTAAEISEATRLPDESRQMADSPPLTQSVEVEESGPTAAEILAVTRSSDESIRAGDSPALTESVESADAGPTAAEISEAARSRDKSLVTTDSSTPMAAAQAENVRARSIEATHKEAAVDKEVAVELTVEAASLTRAERSESDSMAATESEASETPEAPEAPIEAQPNAIVSPTVGPPDRALEQQAKAAAAPEGLSSAPEGVDASGEPPVEAAASAEAAGVEAPGHDDSTPKAGFESEDAAAVDLGPPSQEAVPPPADAANPSSRALLLWRSLEGATAVLALALTAVWLWKRREARR